MILRVWGSLMGGTLMGKAEFDIVMGEIDAIAEKVNSFPRPVQETVYRDLVDTLLDRQNRGETTLSERTRSGLTRSSSWRRNSNIAVDRNAICSYYSKHELDKINDMEYAAFCAYFVSELASEEAKRKSIDEALLLEMFEIAGRPMPGNARSTLNNARRVREYLILRPPGKYSLSEDGRKYVLGLLKKESAT